MSAWLDRFYRSLPEPLTPRVRWLLVLVLVPLALGATQRLWTIHFLAPQYPKGLELQVYAYTIAGGNGGQDLSEINTLNHYVGMRKLDPADFADLDFIPFAIGGLLLLTLRVAAIGDVRSLLDLAVLTGYFGLFSLGRFGYTLWGYGHHLDPTAPIHMEGFMPPLIGSREVGNFVVVSYPSPATFLIGLFAVAVMLLAAWHVLGALRGPRAAPA